VLVPIFNTNAGATVLTPETVAAWETYVQTALTRLQEHLRPGHAFLSIDDKEGMTETVRGGEPIVFPFGRTPQKVPAGLIHDWVGITFVPNAKLDDVVSTVRDYAHYSDFYRPVVIKSGAVENDGSKDRFSMVLMNKSIFSRIALDGDYESSYARIDDHRCYSISKASRIQEIENYGTREQRLLPENEGTGLIWRVLSISRFEEDEGGVYVEMEVIALSRDIPVSLRWIATPIVRRVSKHSLLTSLEQTSAAVHSRKSMPLPLSSSERQATARRENIGTANPVVSLH
jgi:hypothetical protein